MEEWKEVRLGDYCDFQNGYAFKSSEFKTNGEYKIVKIKELKDGLVKFFDDSASVDVQDIKEFEKYKIYRNDVLFALTGDPVSKPNPLSWVGRVSIYRSDENALLNQRTCKIKKSEKFDNQFLYYYFRQWDNFYALASKATGSASQANISTNTIADTIIKLPPLPTQQKIAAILSSLDDKIELNNKINTNLEQQAQSLFKNWFVDFEPFGGKMPEGWKVGTVSEIITLHDSKRIPLSSQQREKMEKKYPYYGATSLMDYVDNYLFDGIFLLLGEDGTVVDSEGFSILQYVEGKFWVNNHAHILTGKNGFSVEMLYLLFSLTNVKDKVTGAVQQKISQGNLNNISTIIPPEEVCKKFDLLIQPLFAQIRNLKQENDRLSALRDTLLPKLMNGEIEV